MFTTSRCDADPGALAKYVVALVKKDKSENDLKNLCKEQLEVFLQKGGSYSCCDLDVNTPCHPCHLVGHT